MSQNRVRKILETRLAAWAASRVPPLPVLWENVRVVTEPAGEHLRAYVMPATTLSPYMAGEGRTFIGIFQVSIFTLAGAGPKRGEEIAAALDVLYPCGEIFQDAGGLAVQVMAPVSASTAQQDGAFSMVAASFRYESHTTIN